MSQTFDLIVRGGIAATPNGIARCDVGVRDGRIAEVGQKVSAVMPCSDPRYRDVVRLVRPGEQGLSLGCEGLLIGAGQGRCRIEQVESTLPVAAGDLAFASGAQGVTDVPLLYGRVVQVEAVPGSPHWQNLTARVSHFLLYALLFITPVLGWLMSSARNFSVSWWGLVTLPDFIEPNRAAYERLHDLHEFMAQTLAVIALVHIAAALKHHFVDRDDVLRRMLP